MTRRIPVLVALVAAAPLSGCIAYNEQCQGLVENPNERIGFIAPGQEIFLDRNNTRHANNAIGQLAADAFVDAFAESHSPADFGVLNGGAIRGEGLCVTRNIIREGPMTRGLLHEILLFENIVSAVDLGEDQVVAMLEHSVDRLVSAPQQVVSPTGQFLHVSQQVSMSVDCVPPPAKRITALKIGNDTVQLASPRPTKLYRVAMSAFVLGGGDGYAMLVAPGKDSSRNPAQAQKFGGIDSNIAADYMKRTYNKDLASGLKLEAGRIKLAPSCAVPPRPQG